MPDPSPPPSARPNPVAPAGAPGPSGLATLAVGVTVVAALYFGHEVLVPIVLAVLLSFILAPVVGLLQRWHLGRVVPVIAAVLVALGVILALGSVVGVQLAQLATDLPRYQATIGRKVDALRAGALGRASDLAKEVGRKVQDAAGQAPAGAPAPAAAPPAGTPENPLTVRLSEAPPAPVELARRVLEPVVHPLATLGIVLVVAVFLLLQREDLRDRMIRLFGSGDLHRTTVAMDDAARRLSRYFLAQLGDQRRLRRPDRRGPVDRSACRARSCGASSRRCCASCPMSARSSRPPCRWRSPRPSTPAGRWCSGRWPVRGRRAGHGPGRRAAGLRPQHRPVAVRGRGGGPVLDLALGAGRAAALDAVHGLPGGARPPRRAARVPRRAARRPAGADARRELLPAHAGRRPRRGAGPGRAAAEGPAALLLLRRGGAQGPAARGPRRPARRAAARPGRARSRTTVAR